jgi:hypothetical protein
MQETAQHTIYLAKIRLLTQKNENVTDGDLNHLTIMGLTRNNSMGNYSCQVQSYQT